MNRPERFPEVVTVPAWMRQPGEPWAEWDKRRIAENLAEQDSKFANYPAPSLRDGTLGLAVGVGTFDANGNPKGQFWW